MSCNNIIEKEISGAILCGGHNRRMRGKDKAFIRIGDIPIIQRTIDIFRDIFAEIILITNNPEDYRDYEGECLIVEDRLKDIGPLAGLYTGLTYSTKKAAFFVACDMPFLHNGLVRRQIEYFTKIDCDVLVPRIGRLIEPLHSIYRTYLKDGLYYFIRNSRSYSIRLFLERVNLHYYEIDDTLFHRKAFTNLNTQEDLLYWRMNN